MFNIILYLLLNYGQQTISPIGDTNNAPQVINRVEPTPESKTVYKGLASYYSRNGCIGCSEDRTMANGDPLDDSKLTLAFMREPLGTMVKITNVKTGKSVIAEVTDKGGFEHLKVPKIADLSVATKESIGCGDVCEVEIEKK